MTPQQLPLALGAFARTNEGAYLVLSRTEPPLPIEQFFPDDASVEWLCHVYSADDLVAVSRADLGIVFDQLEHMEKSSCIHVLSRLRDHCCKRILLHCAKRVLTNQELLGLGFIEQKCDLKNGHFYLFDPDLFFERRDWNTPDKWANPQNFRKYRW